MTQRQRSIMWTSAVAALAVTGAVGVASDVFAESQSQSSQSNRPSAFGRTGNQGEGFTEDQTIGGPGDKMLNKPIGTTPPTVIGEVLKVTGENYTVRDQNGGEVRFRITKDTNLDCATGQGQEASMRTGRQQNEQQEIAPTQHMQQQMGRQGGEGMSETQKGQQIVREGGQQGGMRREGMADQSGTQSPSTLGKDSGGDVARGSGFVIGPKGGCSFKTGDRIKAEISDLGTALFVKGWNE